MCEYLLLIMIVLLTLLANVRPSAKNTIATVEFKRIKFIKHDSVDDADKYYFADKHGNVITCYIEER